MLFYERLVVGPALQQEVRDAIGDGQVTLRVEGQIVVAVLRRSGATRTDIDERDLLATRAAVDDPRKEHRVHLGGIVAPHDEHIAGIQVLVAAGRFVDAVAADEAGHRGGHAEARVRVDVVVRQPAFHQLLRRIALGDRPLAGPVDGEAFRSVVNPLGDDVQRLVPGDGLEHAVFS